MAVAAGPGRMRRGKILATLNGRLLREFSGRTIERLRAYRLVRLVLPHVEPILAANVDKEIEKDRIVLARAVETQASDIDPEPELTALFEATLAVDRSFLQQLERLPVRLKVDYALIRPLRLQRIELLFDGAHRILQAWPPDAHLRFAVNTAHTAESFEKTLWQLLNLYAEETRALSRAVHLPLLLARAREPFAEALLDIMRRTGAELAREATTQLFPHH